MSIVLSALRRIRNLEGGDWWGVWWWGAWVSMQRLAMHSSGQNRRVYSRLGDPIHRFHEHVSSDIVIFLIYSA